MPADLSRRAGDAVRELVRLGALRSAWVPGMAATGDGWFDVARICNVDSDGEPTLWEYRGYCRGPWTSHTPGDETPWDESHSDPRPDTDDPLTVFGLLLLAREACGDDCLVTFCIDYGPGGVLWDARFTSTGKPAHEPMVATEKEAIVAALEAAVEARRG